MSRDGRGDREGSEDADRVKGLEIGLTRLFLIIPDDS
jgi:hypothetical protein